MLVKSLWNNMEISQYWLKNGNVKLAKRMDKSVNKPPQNFTYI